MNFEFYSLKKIITSRGIWTLLCFEIFFFLAKYNTRQKIANKFVRLFFSRFLPDTLM